MKCPRNYTRNYRCPVKDKQRKQGTANILKLNKLLTIAKWSKNSSQLFSNYADNNFRRHTMAVTNFNACDAVALAWFMRRHKIDEIDSPDQATAYLKKIEELRARQPCRTQGAEIALKKLSDKDTFERIANIHDDSFGNDVEYQDLLKGFVRDDIYVGIRDELKSGKLTMSAMQRHCGTIVRTLKDMGNSSAVPDDTKERALKNGLESCRVADDEVGKKLAVYTALQLLFTNKTELALPISDELAGISYPISTESIISFSHLFGWDVSQYLQKLLSNIWGGDLLIPAELAPYIKFEGGASNCVCNTPVKPAEKSDNGNSEQTPEFTVVNRIFADLAIDLQKHIKEGTIKTEDLSEFIVDQIANGNTDYTTLMKAMATKYPVLKESIDKILQTP